MFVTWVLMWMASSSREHFYDLPRYMWSFMRALTILIYVFFTVYNQRLGNVGTFQNAGALHTFLVIEVQNVRDQIMIGRKYKHA